jgi:hypothetical protein
MEGDFYSYRLCLPCRAFIERHFEQGNLERGEPFEWDWLPDIARDAGEPWPPCDSDGTATAAINEDLPVPQDLQARAESIAQTHPKAGQHD